MSRKSKHIVLLIVVLGLLIGAHYYIKNRPVQHEEPQSERVTISKFDKDKLIKMTLYTDKGTLTFDKKDDEWEVDYPHEITLNKSAVDDIAYSFASLYAESVVDEDPEDLSVYGLDNPQATAEGELDDGEKKIFYLGNKTPAGDTYYLMAEGDPKVYVVWMNHGEHFTYELSDVRDTKLPSIDKTDLQYLKLEKKGERTIEIRTNKGRSEDEVSFGLGLWKMTMPYNEPMGVHSDNFQKMLDSISPFSIKDFIDDDPQDLSDYGLEEPEIKFIFKDSENTLELHIGKEHDDKSVYFKLPDSKAVYTLEKSRIDFMDVDPFTIVEKFAAIVHIDDVDRIVIDDQGKKTEITIDRVTKKSEKDEDKEEVEETFKVNGVEMEEKPFKKYYQSLIGLMVDAENNKEPDAKADVTTTFYLNKGKDRELVVEYVPYDNDFYIAVRGGKSEFLVSRNQMRKMLSTLDRLKQGDSLED
ncbi:MAG: DUF4340 domain-containing protein [Clostridiales bacterium]|nr:DUF4340 domain-containing protein [Clostridiales bacterium]